ncbi:MAG: hypothetical protein M5U12_22105, partial [Verrucomicrobia bacterium]|nr:hypothetical protein [Verrucomicrobiota bacterium]
AELLAQRLRERAEHGLRRRSRPVWLRPRPLGIAAAVLLVIFGGVWFFMPRDIPPRGEILYPREGAVAYPTRKSRP